MQNSLALLLSIPLWAASMFIKLSEYRQRGEIVRIYVYSLYGWLVAFAHQSERFFTEAPAFEAAILFLLVDLLHAAICFALAWVCVWLCRRVLHPQSAA